LTNFKEPSLYVDADTHEAIQDLYYERHLVRLRAERTARRLRTAEAAAAAAKKAAHDNEEYLVERAKRKRVAAQEATDRIKTLLPPLPPLPPIPNLLASLVVQHLTPPRLQQYLPTPVAALGLASVSSLIPSNLLPLPGVHNTN
jgi:hypothetical protein